MKTVVVSAVNFTEGGPLTILRACVRSACENLPEDWEIVVLLYDKNLVVNPRIKPVEIRGGKSSWIARAYIEWFGFKRRFGSKTVDLWLSLHDVTPRVTARRQAVYCHNPAPFFEIKLRDFFLDPRFGIFSLFYIFAYMINIKRNYLVVVQQDWLRNAFKQRFGLDRVMVSYPERPESLAPVCRNALGVDSSAMPDRVILLYPALPRVFKNFELLIDAVRSLPPEHQDRIELRLTLDGDENRYSRWLRKRVADNRSVKFIGRLGPEDMDREYRSCSVVVFPSKLETWGLPISEAKNYLKPIAVADLPYARETVGSYDRVLFLPPTDSVRWAIFFSSLMSGTPVFGTTKGSAPNEPFTSNWGDLWRELIRGL